MSAGSIVVPLGDAIRRHVEPGMHLHFASTPSRSNAAIREVARAFLDRKPDFCVSSTGFHSMAHLLPRLGLARRLIGCFFGDHFPAPRPNRLYDRQDLIHWPLWTLVASLRAGAQGDAWAINRSLRGTTMARELAAHGMYREVELAGEPPIGLTAAIRPDVTFIHAAAADEHGHVLMSAPLSEGPWSALAARRGVIVTVERIVPTALTRAHRAAIVLPPHRVLAVCEEPFGAHPQPLLAPAGLDVASYRDDVEHYEHWRTLATDDDAFAPFVERVLRAADGAAAYRAYVGATQLARVQAVPGVAASKPVEPVPAPAQIDPAVNQLIVAGARQIMARVRAIGAQVLIAGIGQAFFAARIAQRLLAAAGVPLRVMVETGLYDVDCGPNGHGYLLAYDNMTRAGRVSAIDDILGVQVGGADNRCLAVLGAAQIDRHGNLNSTRIAGKPLTGSGGACDIAASAAEVIVMTKLAPGRLVDTLDYVTSPGHGVRSIVTDRGVLARDDAGPGWALGDTIGDDAHATFARDCPWPLASASTTRAAPITGDEARLLDSLDPLGKYRHRAG